MIRPFRSSLIFNLLIAALLLTACGRLIGTPPPPTSDARTATLGEVVNLVQARASANDTFAPASLGDVLHVGNQLQTGQDSRARLDFSDGSLVRLAQNSAFTLASVEAAEGNLLTRLKLHLGKIWVSLTGGLLDVETPVGVASVRGSFAIFIYLPGDPNDPNDDVLIVECLEGECTVQNDAVDERLGTLEGFSLGLAGGTRSSLGDQDVQDFLDNNPGGEAQILVAALTAHAPPPGPSNTPRSPAPTRTRAPTRTPTGLIAVDTPTATRSTVARPTATQVPPAPIIGQHIVQAGETLFCIGRAYGVLPDAIAEANDLTSPFTLVAGLVLQIPAVQWKAIPPGPVCPPQFSSPFPGLPSGTSTPVDTAIPNITVTPTATSAPSCPPGEFFDPVMNRCRLLQTPAPPATATSAPTPDKTGPSIINLKANPTTIGATSTCTVNFSADITDPSLISSAKIAWSALDLSGAAAGSGIQAMTGPAGGGTWTGSINFGGGKLVGATPGYGSVLWSISATDNSASLNTNTVAGVTTIQVPFVGGGCP